MNPVNMEKRIRVTVSPKRVNYEPVKECLERSGFTFSQFVERCLVVFNYSIEGRDLSTEKQCYLALLDFFGRWTKDLERTGINVEEVNANKLK